MTHEKVIADYKWIRICKLIPPDFALYYVIINSKLINDPLLELGAWRSFWGFNTWKYWLEKKIIQHHLNNHCNMFLRFLNKPNTDYSWHLVFDLQNILFCLDLFHLEF